MSKSAEPSGNEKCPCGSGKSYRSCCSKRAVRWLRNQDGTYGKSIPLSEEAVEAFLEAKKLFVSIFGRPPRSNDRIFAHSYVDSLADHDRMMLQVMKEAQTPPQFIYAYLKTGRLVGNPENLTTAELTEYSAAIDEFFSLVEDGKSIEDLISPTEPVDILKSALLQTLTICGYFVAEYINKRAIVKKKQSDSGLELVTAFAFVNFTKSLRSISILLENGISYDANYLVRSLYENYLRVKYVYQDPSKVPRILGFDMNTSTSSQADLKKPRKPPPFKNIADALGEGGRFEAFYGALSEVAHSQIATLRHLINDEGHFDFLSINETFEMSTLLSAHEMCMSMLDTFHQFCRCPKYFKKDLLTALSKSFTAFSIGWAYVGEVEGRSMNSLSLELVKQLIHRYPLLKGIHDELAKP